MSTLRARSLCAAALAFHFWGYANLPVAVAITETTLQGGSQFSIAVEGARTLVGLPSAEDWGAVDVYDTQTGQVRTRWSVGDDATGTGFGTSVAIEDGIAIVGARRSLDATEPGDGAAYLFDASTGEQLQKLPTPNVGEFDGFGVSVDVSDGVAIAGAPGHDGASGAAYLFDVATGQQLHELKLDVPQNIASFGLSVAIDGDLAIVGSPNENFSSQFSGAAHVYDVLTGELLYSLPGAEDEAFGERRYFGISVDVSGDNIIVGTSFGQLAYLFDATTGEERFTLEPDEAVFLSGFGQQVAIDGDLAVVGSFNQEMNPLFYGPVHVFDVATGSEVAQLVGSATGRTGRFPGRFGNAIDIDGDRVVVAAANANPRLPPIAGYVFLVPEPGTGVIAFVGFVVGWGVVPTRRSSMRLV